MRPDFSKINLGFGSNGGSNARASGNIVRESPEKIDIKEFYVPNDLSDSEHLGFVSGIPPYLRGPYPTMYITRPWTIR
ncbi:MAG: methylmalonyl-CoA mutase family protein, partial [Candidatus Dadabacteria bacterium]|nr:methylmalonyl-CoA mutase family protein [Candidatus Dadabacteria bacterium]